MKTKTNKKPTRQDLERKVFELEAQLVHHHHFASQNVEKPGHSTLLGLV